MNYDHTQEQLDGLEEYAGELIDGELGEYKGMTFVQAHPVVDTQRRVGKSERARIHTQMLAHSIGLLASVPHFDHPNEMVQPSPEYQAFLQRCKRSDEAALAAAEAKRHRRLERNRRNRPD